MIKRQEKSGNVAKPEVLIAVELVDINKSFEAVQANKNVNLKIHKGTIHGIVGENGAGKSTLMSILYGFYHADSGEIYIDGELSEIINSHDAILAGIGMVHQHFMLVPPFSVIDNVILGAETDALLSYSRAEARKVLEKLEQDYNLEVDLDAIVEDLPVGLQQRVEILKALYKGANILILDEPTGVLTPQETEKFFKILAHLRRQGKTVILITHKLKEIMAITDEVTVMRRGEIVQTLKTNQTNEQDLAELMVGHKVEQPQIQTHFNFGHDLLVVDNLNLYDDQNVHRLKDINFKVRAGEIVGIAGVSGNGQTELIECITGLLKFSSGRITVNDHVVEHDAPLAPKRLRKFGLGHVPEDRLKMGIIKDFRATETAILGCHDSPQYCRRGIIDWEAVKAKTQALMKEYDVRPLNHRLRSVLFSGGNQQKLVMAREIDQNPEVLIVGQPTRGVDIGAIEFIHSKLISLRDAGKAILLVSVELEEIMALSDRVIVMFDGQIMGELTREKVTEKKIGRMMAGVSVDSRTITEDEAE